MAVRSSLISRLATLSAGSVLIIGTGLSRQSSTRDTWQRLLQDAYSAHLSRVQAMLSPHSGLPPLLDLSKSNPNVSGIDRSWENKWKGLGFSKGITDPGVPGPSEATSIATTFLNTMDRPSALPAQSCPVIVISEAVAGESRIDCSRSFVYSRFSLKISKVLKGKRKGGISGRRTSLRYASRRQSSVPVRAYDYFHTGEQRLFGRRKAVSRLYMETAWNQNLFDCRTLPDSEWGRISDKH